MATSLRIAALVLAVVMLQACTVRGSGSGPMGQLAAGLARSSHDLGRWACVKSGGDVYYERRAANGRVKNGRHETYVEGAVGCN